MVENPDQRLIDINTMFTTPFLTEATGVLNKYSVSYIFFSQKAKQTFDIEELPYMDEDCFREVYKNKDVVIYETLCRIEKVSR